MSDPAAALSSSKHGALENSRHLKKIPLADSPGRKDDFKVETTPAN
jgi:hypothetical protein